MKVQITIRGRRYTVRSEEGDVDPIAVARYVDARMAEFSQRASTSDEYTVALLTAMNIASDFERFRRDIDADLDALDREVASATLLLEAATGEGDGGVEDEFDDDV